MCTTEMISAFYAALEHAEKVFDVIRDETVFVDVLAATPAGGPGRPLINLGLIASSFGLKLIKGNANGNPWRKSVGIRGARKRDVLAPSHSVQAAPLIQTGSLQP